MELGGRSPSRAATLRARDFGDRCCPAEAPTGSFFERMGFSNWMTLTGVRDDTNQYFRTLPRFETAAPKHAFLNRLLAVGIGEAQRDKPVHTIEEIL
jgi:hypothetical protein